MREASRRAAQRIDRYTRSLMEHGVRQAETDIAWLNELIDEERAAHRPNA